jgi:hypothetical protein
MIAAMATTIFAGVNETRAVISRALVDVHGDRYAALPEVGAYLRAGLKTCGWVFVAQVATDLDAGGSPTLRAVTMRALEMTDDPGAALRLVGRLVDRRDNPELAALIWREVRTQVVGAVWRALRAEDQARRRRAGPQQMVFRWPERSPLTTA